MRRSLHFVPGGNEKMIAKALTLPADGLILDLEDAVTPDRKAATRPIVRRWLETLDFGGRERWIRMNPIFTDHAEADLAETIAGRPDGYVVPKPRRAEDVRRVAAMLDALEQRHGVPFGSTRLVLIATETPEGLLNIQEIAGASPRTVAVSWGIEDSRRAMGLPRTRDDAGPLSRHPALRARDVRGGRRPPRGWRRSTRSSPTSRTWTGCAASAGKGSRWASAARSPSTRARSRSSTRSSRRPGRTRTRRWTLIAAFEEQARRGAGAFAWKGQMMDMPHLTRARKIAERARRAG